MCFFCLFFFLIEEAPTAHISLSKSKQTVEMLKEKIHALEEKVESLTEERNFLRDRLEDALKLKAEVPERSQNPTASQVESSEDTTSSDSSSDSSEPSQKKYKKKPKKKKSKKARACDFKRVKTPEESVCRYQKVLRLVKSGSTKADAYNSVGVDRNTIVNQAPIAELAAVSPDMFKILRAGFKKGDSLLKFAEKCMPQCILEPNASQIRAMKEASGLLDILKK
ncbi:coiled-coil domain-containing protein 106-like [Carassius auratus]|uniref:Coiled-coil domain-containing protein 106-like n=1 Tax=Carassius auratus TaxID=7957 RepID=A0A6P6NQG2_CARAU|nr:coiled-coil domain-containing protein 106-like [Carassius auratus]